MSSNVFQRNRDSPEPTGHVTLPEGYTTIAEYAFDGCHGLTSITFPDSLTHIGESAFYECDGLTSITFPNSLTEIGDNAFNRCYGLASITFPTNLFNEYHTNRHNTMFTEWVPHTKVMTALMWKQHHQRPSDVVDMVLHFILACQRVNFPQELVDIILGYVDTGYMLCSQT